MTRMAVWLCPPEPGDLFFPANNTQSRSSSPLDGRWEEVQSKVTLLTVKSLMQHTLKSLKEIRPVSMYWGDVIQQVNPQFTEEFYSKNLSIYQRLLLKLYSVEKGQLATERKWNNVLADEEKRNRKRESVCLPHMNSLCAGLCSECVLSSCPLPLCSLWW